MLRKNVQVHIALRDKLKQDAEVVLKSVGLTLSEAVRVFLRAVVMEKEIPFPVYYSTKIPNRETREAIAELESGKGEKVTLTQLKAMWEDD